jgi:hypothetical protein
LRREQQRRLEESQREESVNTSDTILESRLEPLGYDSQNAAVRERMKLALVDNPARMRCHLLFVTTAIVDANTR